MARGLARPVPPTVRLYTGRRATTGTQQRVDTVRGTRSGVRWSLRKGALSPQLPSTCEGSTTLSRRGGAPRHSLVVHAAAEGGLPRPPPLPKVEPEEELKMQEEDCIRVRYHRPDGQYSEWGLHVFGGAAQETVWAEPLLPTGQDEFGCYWDVPVTQGVDLECIVHRGDEKDVEARVPQDWSNGAWMVTGQGVFGHAPDLGSFPMGNLQKACAAWVDETTLLWHGAAEGADGTAHKFSLVAGRELEVVTGGDGVVGQDTERIPLEVLPEGASAAAKAKFPHMQGWTALCVEAGVAARVLKLQLALAVATSDGRPLDATSVQTAGALDDVFAYDGPLGASISSDGVEIAVWAPTAQNIRLRRYDSPTGGHPVEVLDMREQAGVWSVDGPLHWVGSYYQYEIVVHSPWTLRMEHSVASDPYSRCLSANGERTLIVDLADDVHAPPAWATLAARKPPLEAFVDMAIYELHVRDFSAMDETVPEGHRGKFMAFTCDGSAGTAHLRGLAEAGMTHVHLLPLYDFGSVDERPENWRYPDGDLSHFEPDSTEQQARVFAVANDDNFNWGYDPVHYGVPDGSYATDPDGPARVYECRAMVDAINTIAGLRVVLDVVYNHTHGAGAHSRESVLDKVVPGYYHRRSASGDMENSTCCNNTASEHYMMGRLIVDDLLHWATTYKVDGFRFDLMGHIMLSVMERARDALRALTVEQHGVDGSKIYLYGEGWDYAEVENNQRGVNASQWNLAHTGIGSFNDRVREACNGGSPFADPRLQGYLTGLALQPNGYEQGDAAEQAKHLDHLRVMISLGLAGNLRDFAVTDSCGNKVLGSDYGRVAYAVSPEETVNYVSAHDNETLFDTIMLKASPDASLADRCRMNHLATAVIGLSQGIPFFHAGDEILRSKSLDRDSYNSGDWFNRLDFSYKSNNFGVGLPGAEKNQPRWEIHAPLLANPALKPSEGAIRAALDNMHEVLRLRRSSPLFRLRSAADVAARVQFHNDQVGALPGVIVMALQDGCKAIPELKALDPHTEQIVVVFNARPDAADLVLTEFVGSTLMLHSIQETSKDLLVRTSSFDGVTGTFSVPARTAAVFIKPR